MANTRFSQTRKIFLSTPLHSFSSLLSQRWANHCEWFLEDFFLVFLWIRSLPIWLISCYKKCIHQQVVRPTLNNFLCLWKLAFDHQRICWKHIYIYTREKENLVIVGALMHSLSFCRLLLRLNIRYSELDILKKLTICLFYICIHNFLFFSLPLWMNKIISDLIISFRDKISVIQTCCVFFFINLNWKIAFLLILNYTLFFCFFFFSDLN